MKLATKALIASVAMALGAQAQAAIDTDSLAGGGGLLNGSGVGELFFNIWNDTANTSLVLDLNLTVNDFRNNNASLINTFSVTDSGLASYISAANTAGQSLLWNIGGISNAPLSAGTGFVTTHGNAGATIAANEAPLDGNGLTVGMNGLDAYASVNNTSLGATGTSFVSGETDASGFSGGSLGDTFSGSLFFSNVAGLNDQQKMSFLYLDESNPLDGSPLVQTFANGSWKVSANGAVSYVGEAAPAPVPVPAAVWLLGSSLIGLVGIARRRQEA